MRRLASRYKASREIDVTVPRSAIKGIAAFAVICLSAGLFARGSLAVFVASPERFEPRAAELFAVIASGAVRIEINRRHPLADAARAHADLEGRRTTGSSVLIP